MPTDMVSLGLCTKGKIAGHFVTMVMYIALGVWVLLATNETSRVAAGSLLVGVSVLGCVPCSV